MATLVSCNDSFLDCFPQHQLTDANFWKSEKDLVAVANTFTVNTVGKDWLNKTEILADSAPFAVTTSYRLIGAGNYTSDLKHLNYYWRDAYHGIGKVNYFLANYNRAVNVPEPVRERYAAEAYFYRAYYYWILTTCFGDVPLITTRLDVDSPDVFRGRDPRKDVIDRVTKDLEEHYKALPDHIEAASSEFGRISQCAALALLSRIYLYNERWEEAADAAERAMANSYHRLYSTGHPDVDYVNLFNYTGRASRNAENRETLLAYIYNYDLGDAHSSHNLSRECWDGDYSRWAPTNSMIECYLTDEGQIWNPESIDAYPVSERYARIFEHRDPRMKQSLLAPGELWCGGENRENMVEFEYPKFQNDKKGCMSYTGYYMRKYVEPSTVRYVGHDDNDIVYLRLAEVYLNYAEAKCMAGTLTQADLDKSINKLRDRVGMAHMDMANLPAGSDILTEIRRERRVELFFEGQRYFDIRRWKQGELLAEPLLGIRRDWIDVSKVESEGNHFLANLKWKTVDGKQYLLLEDGRHFQEKHYLFPIPFDQMQHNPNLAPNNPGW